MRLFLLALLIAATIHPAFADTSEADKARIQMLEDQISQLKAEIRRLRQTGSEMQTRMNQINITLNNLQNANGTQDEKADTQCEATLADLVEKRDLLMSMGLRESHPDIVNISALITDVQKKCEAGKGG